MEMIQESVENLSTISQPGARDDKLSDSQVRIIVEDRIKVNCLNNYFISVVGELR